MVQYNVNLNMVYKYGTYRGERELVLSIAKDCDNVFHTCVKNVLASHIFNGYLKVAPSARVSWY